MGWTVLVWANLAFAAVNALLWASGSPVDGAPAHVWTVLGPLACAVCALTRLEA